MADASGYIKRVKSLSLIVLGAALLTYDVAESSKSMHHDFNQAQQLFLVTQLARAEIPGNGIISRVDERPAADWLRSAESVLPEYGGLLDVIHSWQEPGLRVEGTFKLSNGELVKFSRPPWPGSTGALASAEAASKEIDRICAAERQAICHVFTLDKNREEAGFGALLVYGSNLEQATSAVKKSWRYYNWNSGGIETVDQLEAQVIRLALPWLGTAEDAESAYLGLREKLQQRTVRIPVINLDVKASRVALFLTVFSFVIAALLAHSLLAIGNLAVESTAEPWILLIPGNRRSDWTGGLQSLLSLGGGMAIIVLLWCPVFIIVLSLGMTQPAALVRMEWVLLIVTAIASGVSTLKVFSILYSIHG